jgi:hypothetical protein
MSTIRAGARYRRRARSRRFPTRHGRNGVANGEAVRRRPGFEHDSNGK